MPRNGDKLAGLEGIHARVSDSGNVLLLALDKDGNEIHFATVYVLPQGCYVVHYGATGTRQYKPRIATDAALIDMYGKRASALLRYAVTRATKAA